MDIDDAAKIVWNYMQMHMDLKPADAIFVLCSMDTRVANRAAELYNNGYGPKVIISGGSGKLTKDVFTEPEAHVFAAILARAGVPDDAIILEDKSTNTGENIRFTYDLLLQQKHYFKSFILVQKPYMERRTYATFKKQWPEEEVDIMVTSPQLSYTDYFTDEIPKDFVINIMVGDLQRIREYPRIGFQIEQQIPDEVWRAYEQLVSAGYTQYLMDTTNL